MNSRSFRHPSNNAPGMWDRSFSAESLSGAVPAGAGKEAMARRARPLPDFRFASLAAVADVHHGEVG
jgi:hypothetical protein